MPLNSTNRRETRRFGLFAALFFGALFGLGIWLNRPVPTLLGGLLALLGIALILAPGPLRPVHRVWMRIGRFVGQVVTTSVLVLAYYLVITPAAVLKSVFGGRPLPLRPDKTCASYWAARSEPAQTRERFAKRY